MTHKFDMELARLFDEKREPVQEELFVQGVSRRITRLRRAHRTMIILLAIACAAIFAVLTPWLVNLTGYIVFGTSIFALSVAAFLLSPIGCSVGFGVGLFVYLKTRF